MKKFQRYDFASKNYIAMLAEAADGRRDVSELIPASAAVQDALSEIRDLNANDRAFVEATAAYIKSLSAAVKGSAQANVAEFEAEYIRARRRVIVEAPVSHRSSQAA
jgi:hypothetical protein